MSFIRNGIGMFDSGSTDFLSETDGFVFDEPHSFSFDGVDYPGVPEGAVGRVADSSRGMVYDIPPGTHGLHPSITSVRVMEPTHGKYPYPHGYAGYFRGKQPAHPGTGRTVDRSDPAWHIPLTPEQGWP